MRLSPTRDTLAGFVALVIGWAVALFVWDRILLPFANPLGIVGPLTLKQFNPTNNLLRYLVFIATPALLYTTFVVGFGTRGTVARVDGRPSVSRGGAAGLALVFAVVAAVAALLRLLSQPLAPTHLDFFHAGEWLAPGWNLAEGRGLWRGSLFIHGAFYDAVGTVLAWDLFGQRSIGAGVLLQDLLTVLLAPTLAVAALAWGLCASPGRRSPVTWAVTVTLALLVTEAVTAHRLHELTCANQALSCDPATISYAGSGGTLAQCDAVLDVLYGPGSVTDTLSGSHRDAVNTTCAAADVALARACACS